MPANNTLLCILRDPSQLSLLQENGFQVVTATNSHDGLRLFTSQPVDAILLDYHLGLLDGPIVTAEIKHVKPRVPIVLLAEDIELPDHALKSVDALVTNSDGPHFLLATVRSVLRVEPALPSKEEPRTQTPGRLAVRSVERTDAHPSAPAIPNDASPFSQKEWMSIRNGSVRF